MISISARYVSVQILSILNRAKKRTNRCREVNTQSNSQSRAFHLIFDKEPVLERVATLLSTKF